MSSRIILGICRHFHQRETWLLLTLSIYFVVHFQYTCVAVSELLTCNSTGNSFINESTMLKYRVCLLGCFLVGFVLFGLVVLPLVLIISRITYVATFAPFLSVRLFHTFVIVSFSTFYISTRYCMNSYLIFIY